MCEGKLFPSKKTMIFVKSLKLPLNPPFMTKYRPQDVGKSAMYNFLAFKLPPSPLKLL